MAVWLEQWFGAVRFTALGGRYEQLLTACAAGDIPLQQVRPMPGGFTASTPLRCYRRLHPLARRSHTRLRVQKRTGLWFWLRRYRGRWGLLVGPAVFLAAIALLQNLVWSVRFVGLDAAQQAAVRQALTAAGICEGTAVTQPQLRAAERAILSGQQGLGWVSLNFIKGRLVVEGAAALPKPEIEPNDPVDLVAAADATLLSLTVQEGYALKQPGQTVAEGEVLVSAVKEGQDQQPIPSHARASAWARLERSYTCTQPLQYTARFATGRTAERRTLLAAGHRLPLWDAADELQGETRLSYAPLELFGFGLPVTVETALTAEQAEQTVTLSPAAARQFARYACEQALAEEFPGAKLLTVSEQETWDEGALTLRRTVQFEADIARPASNSNTETPAPAP